MAEPIIHTWQSYFGERSLSEHAARNPNSAQDATLPRSGSSGGPVIEARVSGSCWIADCPSGDGGAEFVNFDDPRFFCCACRNAAWDNQPIRVKLPTDKQRAAIEAVLVARDDQRTRNWLPGETLAFLRAENLAHGVAS